MQNIQEKTALGLDPNLGALICYAGNLVCSLGLIYSIIVIVNEKNNKFMRFHAWQSILCSGLGLIFGLIIGIGAAAGVFIDSLIGFPILSLGIGLIAIVLGLVFFIMFIKAALKAYKGEIYKISVIGNYAEKWSQSV